MVSSSSLWPLRAEVEQAWRDVIAGRRTREDVHLWAKPYVEGEKAPDPRAQPVIKSGLYYLHGLDLTSRPGQSAWWQLAHGGEDDTRTYVFSDDTVRANLEHWLGQCRSFDADPEEFMRHRRRLAAAEFGREIDKIRPLAAKDQSKHGPSLARCLTEISILLLQDAQLEAATAAMDEFLALRSDLAAAGVDPSGPTNLHIRSVTRLHDLALAAGLAEHARQIDHYAPR